MALERPERLWDKMLEHLRERGSDSISGVARAVSEGRENPIHRLTVAGYLAAMTEVGVLREVPRPPSKHYRLANPHLHRSIYDRVATAARAVADEQEWPVLAVAALSELFGRPLFKAELHAAGIPLLPALLEVSPEEATRGTLRTLLHKNARFTIPSRDPLYKAPQGSATPGIQRTLRRALLSATQAQNLATDDGTGQQLRLGGPE